MRLITFLLFLLPILSFGQTEYTRGELRQGNTLNFKNADLRNNPYTLTRINASLDKMYNQIDSMIASFALRSEVSQGYNFIKRNDTTLLKGVAKSTRIYLNTPDDTDVYSEFKIDMPASAADTTAGGVEFLARKETTSVLETADIYLRAFEDSDTESIVGVDYSAGPRSYMRSRDASAAGVLEFSPITGALYTGTGTLFNRGIVESTDLSANYVAGSHTRKSYVDGKIAQTITNGVTTSAPSQDVLFDALAPKLQSNATNTFLGNTIFDANSFNFIVEDADDITLEADNELLIQSATKTVTLESLAAGVEISSSPTGSVTINGGTGGVNGRIILNADSVNIVGLGDGVVTKKLTVSPDGNVKSEYQLSNPCTLPNCLLKFNGTTFVAIDVTGASIGDVLTYTGTDVDWATGGGGSGTVTSITLTQPAAGLTITGSGTPITTTGTPTFALANDLAALEGLSSTGIASRTGTDAWGLITNSSGLAGVISDETGTGALVFGTSPTFTTQITTPSVVSASALSLSGTSVTAIVSGVTNNLTNWEDVTESGTSVTITEAHRGREVFLTNTSPIAVTLSNGLTDGFNVTLTKAASAGVITVSAASGTLNTVGGVVTLNNDFSSATFRTYASNVWYGSGGLGSGGGGGGTVDDVSGTSPITVTPTTGNVVVSIADVIADGSTKGAAGLVAADFNTSSGIASIDYANGQAATSGQDGFLQSADWTTFNNKQATGLSWLLSGTGQTFTAPVGIVGSPTNTFTMTFPGIGATITNGAGIYLRNTSTALTGAQQSGPYLTIEGQGHFTNSGGGSSAVGVIFSNTPVQGAAAPTMNFQMRDYIAAGASASFYQFQSSTNLTTIRGGLTMNGLLTVSSGGAAFTGSTTSTGNVSAAQRLIGEAIQLGLDAKTANYTVAITDYALTGDATSSNIMFSLPAASTATNSIFFFKRLDASANTITLDGSGSETIDGALTYLLVDQYDRVGIQSNGTNWLIIYLNTGQEVAAIQSTYTNYTTTATYQNITSIALGPGSWDLSSFFTYSSNSATITAAANAIFVISTTTASAAGATEGRNIAYVPQAALLGTSLFSEAISPYRVTVASGTTTYYLNSQATFTLGNPQFVGGIRAVRVK